MAAPKRDFIANQIFVGLPWKTVRPRYEKIIHKLEIRYPIHLTIVGRNDGQSAENLLEIIKERIQSSSYAVFDATGGNANVSLEYGYAEGLEVPRAIFLSDRKVTHTSSSSPIISDLHGQRRVSYKTEKKLQIELEKLCREHNFTKRFEKALASATKGLSKGDKKSSRALAIKIFRALDGKTTIRRAELIQNLQAQAYKKTHINLILKKFHALDLLNCTVGKYSEVRIT
jgi:hypothetical protein